MLHEFFCERSSMKSPSSNRTQDPANSGEGEATCGSDQKKVTAGVLTTAPSGGLDCATLTPGTLRAAGGSSL